MPQSDIDEAFGRTVDGVARTARYLAAFDAIKAAILVGDLSGERVATEEVGRLYATLSHEERLEVAYPMIGKLAELSDAYRGVAAVIDAPRASTTETQATISAWAEATFGPAGSNARAVARANREMAELLEHVTADDRHPDAAEEIADVVIVLYRVAERLGVDLHERIDAKMARNRARKWRLDGTGHGYHVATGVITRSQCITCHRALAYERAADGSDPQVCVECRARGPFADAPGATPGIPLAEEVR